MTIDETIAAIKAKHKEQTDADYGTRYLLEATLKTLLFATGPIEFDGVRLWAQMDYDSANLYQERTVQRGCVTWKKRESFWSGPGDPYQRMESAIKHIIEQGILSEVLKDAQHDAQLAAERLARVKAVADRVLAVHHN